MAQTRSCSGSEAQETSMFIERFFTVILILALGAFTACSSLPQSSSSTANSSHTVPSISLAPENSQIPSGATQQFTAQVQNTSNTGVVWSANVGSISSTGLFSAPKVTASQPVTIIATSLADSTVIAKVTATVVAPQKLAALKIMTSGLAPATSGIAYDSTLSASGGAAPYQWLLTSGALPSGLQLNSSTGLISGVPNQAGTSSFTLTLKDAAAHQTAQSMSMTVARNASGAFDGPAELPRVTLPTSLADTPAPGTTTPVAAGGDLQAALDNASCGDTITLQAGATFGGLFYLPQKSCDSGHWIIIRTSAPDSSLPPEGTRLTPCYAGVASLPGRPSFNCSSTANVLAKLVFTNKTGSGPLLLESGANHYRLIGLEITRTAGTSVVSNLITPETGVPANNIILDRVWMHGTAQDETTRGIYLAGVTSAAVIDSFFTDFHCIAITGACTDSQAIGGGGGNLPAGPYKIFDNFLEASGENILFGGGAATTSPADIEIQQNHLFKPLIWMAGQPGFVGGANGNPFVVKNNFELKNGQRVLFEGNIVEYTWGGFTQYGYSLVLTPKNQAIAAGNVCPSCLVTDVTIRYSTVSHAAAGINLANVLSENGGMAAGGGRYSIHDITLDDISGTRYQGQGPLVLVLNNWITNILGSISINHITGFGDPSRPVLTVGNDVSNPKMADFTFTNNLVSAGAFPVYSSGGKTNCAYSDIPVTVLETCFDPYSFVSNAFIVTPAPTPSKWPAGNYFPVNAAAVQFVNFNNGVGGDYHLLPSSPYKNAGPDGKDLGADVDAILAATANAY